MLKEQPQFTVSLPDSLQPFVEKLGTGSSLDDKIKISVVIGLFTGNVVTLERAAELTSHSVSDFMMSCTPAGFPGWSIQKNKNCRMTGLSKDFYRI